MTHAATASSLTPALKQHLSQHPRLWVMFSGIDQLTLGKTAIGSFDRVFPVLHVNLQSNVDTLNAACRQFLGVKQNFKLAT